MIYFAHPARSSEYEKLLYYSKTKFSSRKYFIEEHAWLDFSDFFPSCSQFSACSIIKFKKKFPPCSFSSFTKKMGFVGVKFINYAIYLTVIAHFFQSAFPAFLNIIIIFTQYFTIFSSLLFRGYLI